MRDLLGQITSGVAKIWCRRMHPAPMWPIHNHYVCPRCQRQWPVLWVEQPASREPLNETRTVQQLQPVQRSV